MLSIVGPTEVEIRVLGALVEKQKTTPDHYPLTLNALRAACNQSTNRDPVVAYDEETLREAIGRLTRRRWIRSASGHSGRVPKYRHLIDEELGLSSEQLALLAVMMLRGPQTPGELKQRADRLHSFADLDEVHRVLEELLGRTLAVRLPRAPGQKEERYRQLLGGSEDEKEETAAGSGDLEARSGGVAPGRVEASVAGPAAAPERGYGDRSSTEERLHRLESELAGLKQVVSELRSELGLESD